MAKKRVARRGSTTKKTKTAGRVKARAASKKTAPRKPAPKKPAQRAAAPKAVTPKAVARRKPALQERAAVKPVAAEADATPSTAAPPEAHPHAFFDPSGVSNSFTGDAKAHTKPQDQRSMIRAKGPRTWSNRQPGRG